MLWSLNANIRSAAAANTAKLSAAFKIGYTPQLQHGTYYINGPVLTRPIVGCGRIKTDGSFGTPQDGHPTRTGAQVRIVQLGKGPCLRLCGAGFILDDPIEWVGDGASAIIEVEGRAEIPTGRHRFRNQIFQNAGAWVKCLGGYYNGIDVVDDENHADNSIIDGCEGFNCDRALWLQNQQAVNWKLRDCVINKLGDKACVVADIERGGEVTITGLCINDPQATIFRIRDYSPNTCRLICRDFARDRMPAESFPGNYLRLLDYVGSGDYRWDIEISGVVKTHHAPMDPAMAFKGCETLPRTRWKINIPDYYSFKGGDVL